MKTNANRSRDRRLLMGYGPGVFLATAFVIMAVLVPTVAPQQDVSVARRLGRSQSQSRHWQRVAGFGDDYDDGGQRIHRRFGHLTSYRHPRHGDLYQAGGRLGLHGKTSSR